VSVSDDQSPDPTIDVHTEARGSATVLTVRGDLDAFTSPLLEATINEFIAGDPRALIIDLSELDFLGSAGMAVLIRARQSIGESTPFAVVADGPSTSRPMKIIGLDNELSLYPTLDVALKVMNSSDKDS
jgi:anti-sigma B factor antagonist